MWCDKSINACEGYDNDSWPWPLVVSRPKSKRLRAVRSAKKRPRPPIPEIRRHVSGSIHPSIHIIICCTLILSRSFSVKCFSWKLTTPMHWFPRTIYLSQSNPLTIYIFFIFHFCQLFFTYKLFFYSFPINQKL